MLMPRIPVSLFYRSIGFISSVGAVIALAGCNQKPDDATTQASPPGSSDSSAASDSSASNTKTPAGGKSSVIGLTVQAIDNPFFVAVQNGAQDEAKKGGASVTTQDGRHDIGNQSNILDDFIQQHVSFVLLNAVDSAGIAPAVARVRKAGIPVIAVDVGADGGVNVTLTSDNVQAGRLAAQYMVDRLHGKGNIAVVDGPPVTAVHDRDEGLKQVLAKNPGIKVVSTQVGVGSRDSGMQLGTDILTANPHLDAVFAINDPTALGVELSAKQANRKDLFIVSIDGSPDAITDMKAHGLIAATAAQDPIKLGRMAVQLGKGITEGKNPPQQVIKLPVTLVTQQNMNSYKGWAL